MVDNQQDFINKSFFDFTKQDIQPKYFWFNETQIKQIIENYNLQFSDEVDMVMKCYKRFGEDSHMKEVIIQFRGDILGISRKQDLNVIEGYLPICNVKVEFFENLSDQSEPVIGEDFCILFSHNKQFETIFFRNKMEFEQMTNLLRQKCILSHFTKEYTSQDVIGQGTFAKVILATRNSDKTQYAVKTYNKRKLCKSQNSEVSQMGVINEIYIMRKMDHENIIKLHEVYEGEQHIYLVLDLLKGGELFDRIINQGHFGEQQAFQIIIQLINAINHAHSFGVMHRDIKPENLILKEEKSLQLCLVDFGLSDFIHAKEILLTRCGTPGYVAPEVLKDQQYNQSVDIFSCGIILYNLLTGCQVFGGNDFDSVIQKNKNCLINWAFEKINIQISSEALDLLQKMLEEDPKKRITMDEIYEHPWIINHINNDQKGSQGSQQINHKKLNNQLIQNKQLMKNKNDQNQIMMKTPLISGRVVKLNDNSPCMTPNLNTEMMQGRKEEMKTNLVTNQPINIYANMNQSQEQSSQKEQNKINRKASNINSKLKNMQI